MSRTLQRNNKQWKTAECTVDNINDLAKTQYHKAVAAKRYAPAKNAGDSKAVPSSFAANLSKTSMAQFLTLVQQMQVPKGKPTPPKKPDDTAKQSGRKLHQSSTNGGGNDGGTDPPRWNKIAPSSGEPKVKVVNGKSYYWCVKCKRWCLTHGQEDAPEGLDTRAFARQVVALLELIIGGAYSPAIWHVGFGTNVVADLVGLLAPWVLGLLFIGALLVNSTIPSTFPMLQYGLAAIQGGLYQLLVGLVDTLHILFSALDLGLVWLGLPYVLFFLWTLPSSNRSYKQELKALRKPPDIPVEHVAVNKSVSFVWGTLMPIMLSFSLGCILPRSAEWWPLLSEGATWLVMTHRWSLVAPALWFVLFGMTLWVSFHPTATNDERWKRRWRAQQYRCWRKKKSRTYRHDPAFGQGLARQWHRHYPRRLRSFGIYKSRLTLRSLVRLTRLLEKALADWWKTPQHPFPTAYDTPRPDPFNAPEQHRWEAFNPGRKGANEGWTTSGFHPCQRRGYQYDNGSSTDVPPRPPAPCGCHACNGRHPARAESTYQRPASTPRSAPRSVHAVAPTPSPFDPKQTAAAISRVFSCYLMSQTLPRAWSSSSCLAGCV